MIAASQTSHWNLEVLGVPSAPSTSFQSFHPILLLVTATTAQSAASRARPISTASHFQPELIWEAVPSVATMIRLLSSGCDLCRRGESLLRGALAEERLPSFEELFLEVCELSGWGVDSGGG